MRISILICFAILVVNFDVGGVNPPRIYAHESLSAS